MTESTFSEGGLRLGMKHAATPTNLDAGNRDLISELPLDIHCEIFHWLTPRSLLMLARTSKIFRTFLMSRDSKASVWQPAVAWIMETHKGLPPVPDMLPVPKYVALMCFNECMECFVPSSNRLEYYYHAFTQLCLPCSLKKWKKWKELPLDDKDLCKITRRRDLKDLVPTTTAVMTDKEFAAKNGVSIDYWNESGRWAYRRYHIESLVKLLERFRQIQNPKEKEKFLDDQENALEERMNAAIEYFNAQEDKAEREERACHEKRKIQIRERLAALGWAREADRFLKYELGHKSVYKVFSELTNQEWHGLEEELIKLMEQQRSILEREDMAKRIEQWVNPVYTAFILSQPPNTLVPTTLEITLMDEFRVVLCTMPLDQKLTADMFTGAVARIPAFVEEWRQQRTEQLLGLVRRSSTYRGQEVTSAVLPLASTIFRCTCKEALTFPAVLVHHCNFAPAASSEGVILQRAALRRVGVWRDLESIKFDDAGHEHMLQILDALGWSQMTLVSEMETRQPLALDESATYIPGFGTQIQKCQVHKRPTGTGPWFSKLEGKQLTAAKEQEGKRQKFFRVACPWCMHREDHMFILSRGHRWSCPGVAGDVADGFENYIKAITLPTTRLRETEEEDVVSLLDPVET
ncbi:hypothetical protein EST38_g13183 [Candolleomyces aberdarensis]|uniref:F-box domain-containing protein n=1 Tax=Candolleomyces aberdarensis TaxID=2316362 RepID=A0A4Q2D1P3_9AGAR|nr:hypothetical protein EST38_g13183 [Candolleomyces aberdarensis]